MSKVIEAVSEEMSKDIPVFRSGDRVSVGVKVIEGSRTRIQIFEGTVISISAGGGIDKTFTVRKTSNGVGVERIFPFHSPNIDSINDKYSTAPVNERKTGIKEAPEFRPIQ